jgi:hypothetical protein
MASLPSSHQDLSVTASARRLALDSSYYVHHSRGAAPSARKTGQTIEIYSRKFLARCLAECGRIPRRRILLDPGGRGGVSPLASGCIDAAKKMALVAETKPIFVIDLSLGRRQGSS